MWNCGNCFGENKLLVLERLKWNKKVGQCIHAPMRCLWTTSLGDCDLPFHFDDALFLKSFPEVRYGDGTANFVDYPDANHTNTQI
jgi:hypothetical protein